VTRKAEENLISYVETVCGKKTTTIPVKEVRKEEDQEGETEDGTGGKLIWARSKQRTRGQGG